jgi:DNA-binding Xre family transcriptional regulator
MAPMYRLRIKEVAISKGFNQSSLSRAANISFTTIKKIWRNPYYEINIVTLHKIARTLGVSTSDLIEDIADK